jgi:hypothetical protein
MKLCTRCQKKKPLENFYTQVQNNKAGRKWEYLDSMCKECRSTYTSDRRRETKKKAVLYLGGECVDCSLLTEHYEVYDFHHLDPKTKEFSPGKRHLRFESMVKELDKCVLLCSNCHRIRHACMPL